MGGFSPLDAARIAFRDIARSDDRRTMIAGSSNMTYAGLAHNAELNLGTGGGTSSAGKVREWFEHFWNLSDPYDLAGLYGRLWDAHTPPWSVYLRMLWELYGEHLDAEENPPNVRTGLNLTRFQADGVVRMERLLDEHGGVLVADEVGLGKTFLAGEVIYRTANVNRQRVLIVAPPAALKSSMWEPFLETYDFSRWVKVYSYEEVRNRLDPDKGADRRVPARGRGLLARRHRRGPQPPQLGCATFRCR